MFKTKFFRMLIVLNVLFGVVVSNSFGANFVSSKNEVNKSKTSAQLR
ncbi:MAG: hypothetical protein GY817_03645 [bacterium]|nr:hypothetical protein [bacterium]